MLEIERHIRAKHPKVNPLFVKPQTPEAFRQSLRERQELSPRDRLP